MKTVLFNVGRLRPGVGPFLCDQLTAILTDRPDAAVVVCDVSAVERPTSADLDQLARLRLTAQRAGRNLVLRGVQPRLGLLLALTGLGEVFGYEVGESDPGAVGGQPHRQPP